ncbi:MAG: CopG family transcriptional regulator [Symploca sp. SIO1B1]|nr:CopG family transcriptional regulator [Symploca sp. SIO2D2]NEQ64583.1 CopG family transcriptional regulator [Symploca sp. SIO2D2]NER24785.1 CopG family transcriptional regulator [Symploca sp. SIO1C2]NES01035.1 CopG family transcriptional regulator [Symploca sp. SIO1B1]
MSKSNRFDGLFGATRRTEAQATPSESGKKKGKGQDPDYMRTTIYLPRSLHRKLKAVALEEEREMSEVVTELVEKWLEERGSGSL